MTIKCHEFFGCTKQGCAMFEEGETRNCWEVEPELTPCLHMAGGSVEKEEKIVFCKNCLYYQHINK